MNFKLGDRVRYTDNEDASYEKLRGLTGTVLKYFIGDSHDIASVRWDVEIPGGWDCNGLCENGYGWNVYTEELIPMFLCDEDSFEIFDIDLGEVI